MEPNKIRNYWDIQRAVIGAIDLDKYNLDDIDKADIFEAIRYGIKISHNFGYDRGYRVARRKQINAVFDEEYSAIAIEDIKMKCCHACGYDISTLGEIKTCPYCGYIIVN
jgi:rubrerythrin